MKFDLEKIKRMLGFKTREVVENESLEVTVTVDDEISLENEESFDNEENDKIVEDVVKEEIKEEKNVENISSIVEKNVYLI